MSSFDDDDNDEPTRGRCEDESGDGPPLSEVYAEFLEKQPAANDARNTASGWTSENVTC
jgi:hypothetical protein